jgi:hypothetical protein
MKKEKKRFKGKEKKLNENEERQRRTTLLLINRKTPKEMMKPIIKHMKLYLQNNVAFKFWDIALSSTRTNFSNKTKAYILKKIVGIEDKKIRRQLISGKKQLKDIKPNCAA